MHLGLTEAGMGSKGIVASSAALGILLQQGIGDTIRISLTPEPGGDRTLEVKVAQELLQTMGFRTFVPLVAACPGCGRTTSTTFQELARDIQDFIRDDDAGLEDALSGRRAAQRRGDGLHRQRPGRDRKHADIGISLPGTGEAPAAPVFVDGKKFRTLRGPTIAADFKALVIDYIERRYGQGRSDRGGITADRFVSAIRRDAGGGACFTAACSFPDCTGGFLEVEVALDSAAGLIGDLSLAQQLVEIVRSSR